MRPLLLVAALAITTPLLGNNRQVVQSLPHNDLANLNIVDIDVALNRAAIDTVGHLDSKASEKFEKQQEASVAPALQSRKSYGALPTVVMVAEIMADRMRGWNFTKGRDVRLKVSLDTLKLASAPLALLGTPSDTTVFELAERNHYLGSRDEIGGFVDVIDAASKRRIGSFYIDIVHRKAGPLDLAFRGRSVREKLAEGFTLEAARCLSSPKCQRTKGLEL
jgi:hypothetical protein